MSAPEAGSDCGDVQAGESEHASPKHDRLVDEMSEESFPTSDPPSTWAGSDDA